MLSTVCERANSGVGLTVDSDCGPHWVRPDKVSSQHGPRFGCRRNRSDSCEVSSSEPLDQPTLQFFRASAKDAEASTWKTLGRSVRTAMSATARRPAVPTVVQASPMASASGPCTREPIG